ncbi:MAG: SGNH/GDSL hydrolase family protein [Verrucomicrobia bacterium]|nr:SGNH/GDSL hydrolase family protein [Verrucomicrobiota bacterium]
MKRWFLAIPLAVAVIANAASFPKDLRHIVFLGDSITYGGQYVEFVEAWTRTQWPQRPIEILDLGLPSETVSGLSEPGHAGGKFPRPDLHERLARVLAKTKPDLVIACYGMNCGIYHPFSEARFRKYQDGIRWLREQAAAAGAKIIHLTPPVFDPLPIKEKTLPAGRDEYRQPFEGYNGVLDRYSAWLLEQRKAGWEVVDVHDAMNRFIAGHRKQDAAFTLARDGVHCNETGHWLMAKQLLLHWGAKDVAAVEDPKTAFGEPLLKLIHQRQQILKDAWLTETKHVRPGMRQGLPLGEAQAKAAELEKQITEAAKAAHP